MSLINISYNSGFPFSGQASPFVGRLKGEIDYGERWAAQETIILAGQLTGCTFGALTTAQLALISGFSIDYQPLDITYGMNINSGLVLWYQLYGNLNDASNNGNYGQATNGIFTGGQVFNTGLFFPAWPTATTYSFYLNNFPSGSAPLTMSLWFNLTGSGFVQHFCNYGQNNATQRFGLFYSGGNLGIESGNNSFTFPWSFNTGWHMLTASLTSPNTLSLYLDGVQQSVGTPFPINITYPSNGFLSLASLPYSAVPTGGLTLSDIRIFNRALSPYEISGLYVFGANNGYDLNWPIVYVDSIDFPENKYLGVLPYRITLKSFPSGYFSGYYGVLDPVNICEYKEQEDGVIQIIHTVSARGINTTTGLSDALQNAVNYVSQFEGLQGIVSPIFITSGVTMNPVLIEQKENIDRYKCVYSIIETYLADKYDPCEYGVLRYKVDVQQPQAGFNTAKIDGQIRGDITQSISQLRSRFSGFDPFSNLMFFTNSGINFNPNPLTKQVTEDTYNQIINFSFTYDDNPFNLVNVNYEIGINSGINITEVELKGNINGRGDLLNKWQLVQNYFQTDWIPYQIANSGYISYAGATYTGFVLDPNPIAESISYDSFNGQIDFSYRYTNQQLPVINYFESMDYSIHCIPPLRSIVAEPLLATGANGQPNYVTTDLGFTKRGAFSVDGQIYPKTVYIGSGVALAKNFINSIYLNYTSGFYNVYLDKYEIDTDTKNNIKFAAVWSYDSGDVLNGSPNYTQIVNL